MFKRNKRFRRNSSTMELHHQSELLASEADQLTLENNIEEAKQFYNQASILEEEALNTVSFDKIRTRGILIVSAVALAYKAKNFIRARHLIEYLATEDLPEFVQESLEEIQEEINLQPQRYRNNPGPNGENWGPSLYNPLNDSDHPFKDETHYQKIIAKLRRNPFNKNQQFGTRRKK